jgi:hypothetical protein
MGEIGGRVKKSGWTGWLRHCLAAVAGTQGYKARGGARSGGSRGKPKRATRRVSQLAAGQELHPAANVSTKLLYVEVEH